MSSYLEHHGILGMKWGVRRYQNKDGSLTPAGKKRYSRAELDSIRNEKNEYIRNAQKNDPRRKEMTRIEKEARDLASKYDFDQDDGGGGTTEADKAAGRKYWELWEEYGYLQDAIDGDAGEKATKHILDKYGDVAIKQLKQRENAIAIGFVSAAYGIPLAALGIAIAVSKFER